LCPCDIGFIKTNILLYFSGYLKIIWENSSPEEGILTKDMKPINEWYAIELDGGDLALVGFSTAFANYILKKKEKKEKGESNRKDDFEHKKKFGDTEKGEREEKEGIMVGRIKYGKGTV